jgi:hypothetical protein
MADPKCKRVPVFCLNRPSPRSPRKFQDIEPVQPVERVDQAVGRDIDIVGLRRRSAVDRLGDVVADLFGQVRFISCHPAFPR